MRERGGSSRAYPPINFLHVWWARRPPLRRAVPPWSHRSCPHGHRPRMLLPILRQLGFWSL
ncbi:hypothetical protein GTV15_19085 [Streptomyces sp. SID7803]|nr:hypothetical protein [Streptomyces sp. SID7803]